MSRGRLITIGSFDGVHRGHQALLDRTSAEARKRKLRSLALSFAVPPRMVLDESARRRLLSNELEKDRLLRTGGMDDVKIVRFDRKISEMKAFSFFRDFLIKKYHAKGIVVGMDFRFGAGRSGGVLELVRWGQDFHIPIWVIPPVKFRRKVVSSTLIRDLMERGSFRVASNFLGHPYLIAGKVVRGRGVGTSLGFPTANVSTADEKILPRGVYAVRVRIGRNSKSVINGVANIGVRPTFANDARPWLEVHLFGRQGSLRGKTVFVELVDRIRGEKRFPGVEALRRQITKDVEKARRILSKRILYRK